MKAKKHQLRIACCILAWIDLLQTLHRLNAEWRGCIIEPHQVCREIHHHVSHGRMILRHIGKYPREEWSDDLCKKSHASSLFGNAHEPEKQCHDTDQSYRQGNGILAGFEYPIGLLQTEHCV